MSTICFAFIVQSKPLSSLCLRKFAGKDGPGYFLPSSGRLVCFLPFLFLRLFCPQSCSNMQEDMEMKSGSAVRSVPAESGNDAYESVTLRQKQQLEVNSQCSIDLPDSNLSRDTSTSSPLSHFPLACLPHGNLPVVVCSRGCTTAVLQRLFMGLS
jgi:hypothetical protein